MSNLNREPSTDASYHISIHLAKRFHRRKLFRNQPIRNKNCLWRPCLLTDWNEISNLYREPSFRFIWSSGFRGEDLTNSSSQKQELPVAAMFVDESGQNVQSL
jgi:hypothetical protein